MPGLALDHHRDRQLNGVFSGGGTDFDVILAGLQIPDQRLDPVVFDDHDDAVGKQGDFVDQEMDEIIAFRWEQFFPYRFNRTAKHFL